MMDNKLSELSKPVAWLAIYHGDVYDEAISITRSVVEAQADRFGWESALTEITPLYSQEYVSALLAERDAFEASALALRDEWRASKKSNAFLKEQLAQLANFNPDWDMLEACRESWREVAAALKEAEARLEAKDKRIAELEDDKRQLNEIINSAATPAPAVRDGWKLVPAEPTEEMLRAACRNGEAYSVNAYRAMLAAAPEGGNDHDTRR